MPERVGRRTRELRREEQQPHPVTQPRGRDQRPEPELRHGAGPWPTHDELLSFGVQILVAKRGRVDGIEYLLQFAYMYFVDRALGRKRVASSGFVMGPGGASA